MRSQLMRRGRGGMKQLDAAEMIGSSVFKARSSGPAVQRFMAVVGGGERGGGG